MLEDLKANRCGQPQLPTGRLPTALESFQNLESADVNIWRSMKLASVFNYLRYNKYLKIPVEWRAFVPKLMHEVS